MPRAAVIYTPGYWCDIGTHVFPMEKYARIRDLLVAEGAFGADDTIDPQPASRDQLLLAHGAEYLDDLERLRWTPRTMWSELPLTAEIVRAYVRSAGGTLRAAREALERGAAINLGGGFHHAFAERAEGFCYINDLAVAVRVLQHEGAVGRAAVVDLDVHHGNGTAHIFAGDERVFTVSLHQQANYPEPKPPSDLDIGFANEVGDAEYLMALDRALAAVWRFGPEIVLYQAGADPYTDDLLGGLALTFAGLEERDRRVIEGCADRGIPVVVTLGGGYAKNVDDTVRIHATTCRIALQAAERAPGRAP